MANRLLAIGAGFIPVLKPCKFAPSSFNRIASCIPFDVAIRFRLLALLPFATEDAAYANLHPNFGQLELLLFLSDLLHCLLGFLDFLFQVFVEFPAQALPPQRPHWHA